MQINRVSLSVPSVIIGTEQGSRIDILQMKRFRPLAHFFDSTLEVIICDEANTLLSNPLNDELTFWDRNFTFKF
jgi:hypothetical protein